MQRQTTTNDKHFGGHSAVLVAYIIFGFNMVACKDVLSNGNFPPLALHFFRAAGAALLFWTASIFVPHPRMTKGDLWQIFLASLLGIQLNQLLFLVGIAQTSPIDASIISTSVPILTMVIAALYLREPITWKKALGVAVGAAGALLLVLTSARGNGRSSSLMGDLLCLVSSAMFSCYLVFFKGLVSRIHPVIFMRWTFLFAALCAIPVCGRAVLSVDYSAISTSHWLQIGFVVLMATFVAYLLLPIGQKLLRPTVVSMYNYVQPIIAWIITLAAGLDRFGWDKILSAVLVFAGVWMVTHSKSRAQMEAERE